MSETLSDDARDRQRFVLHATPSRRVALGTARVLFKLLMHLEVRGVQQVPRSGGFVLASNHLTNWDVFAMQLALPRTIFFMAKAELFGFAPLAAVVRDFGAFPVYRGEKDSWAMQHALKVLLAGEVLGMFPEGHRSKGRGLRPFKLASARLALESHCPIVPMAVRGTDRVLMSTWRPAPVTVTFLPMIIPRPTETPEEITERLQAVIGGSVKDPVSAS